LTFGRRVSPAPRAFGACSASRAAGFKPFEGVAKMPLGGGFALYWFVLRPKAKGGKGKTAK